MSQPAITTSSDKAAMDVDCIHQFLTNAYWAKGRTRAEVETTMAHSDCFGVFVDGHQVAFARVLSDYVQLAYLLDVFVLEAHRGNGYSKLLLQCIMDDERYANVQMWRLGTDDAQGLYAQFGFVETPHEGKFMQRKGKNHWQHD